METICFNCINFIVLSLRTTDEQFVSLAVRFRDCTAEPSKFRASLASFNLGRRHGDLADARVIRIVFVRIDHHVQSPGATFLQTSADQQMGSDLDHFGDR